MDPDPGGPKTCGFGSATLTIVVAVAVDVVSGTVVVDRAAPGAGVQVLLQLTRRDQF
jgi:hypothetical protein